MVRIISIHKRAQRKSTDNDDAESFHSALTKVNSIVSETKKSSDSIIKTLEPSNNKRPRSTVTVSTDMINTPSLDGQSNQSSTMNGQRRPFVPRRTSSRTSLPKRSSTRSKSNVRSDPVRFHRQSCQIFSSIDSTIMPKVELYSSISTGNLISPATSRSSSNSNAASSANVSNGSSRATSIAEHITQPKSAQIGQSVNDQGRPFSVHASPRSSMSVPLLRSSQDTQTIGQSRSSAEPLTPGSIRTRQTPRPSIVTMPSYSSQPQVHSFSSRHLHHQNSVANTEPISWTSPETRKKEYAKIDAANSGIRGWIRRTFPKFICKNVGGGRKALHDGQDVSEQERRKSRKRSESDGSVRRFRVQTDSHDTDDAHSWLGFARDKDGTENTPSASPLQKQASRVSSMEEKLMKDLEKPERTMNSNGNEHETEEKTRNLRLRKALSCCFT